MFIYGPRVQVLAQTKGGADMENLAKGKLAEGEKLLGTFFSMGNPSEMECLGYAGMDFAIIDTEHGPFDTESAMGLVRAAESVGLSPFIRIADVSHKEVQRAVDMGVHGLIAPCLRSLDDMKKLVSLAKFPPLGNRGYIRGRGCGYGYQPWASGSVSDYMAASNDRLLVLPQCETRECYEQIEQVLAIDGIDGIFIGPFDLSISLDMPGDFDNPKFRDSVSRVLEACKKAGKFSFIFSTTVEQAQEYLRQGFDGVAHGLDYVIFTEAYKSELAKIRRA